jgi:hypothetical protein
VLVGKGFGFLGVAKKGEQLTLSNVLVGHRPEKLADGTNAYVARSPVLTLHCRSTSVLLNNKVNTAVRVCATAFRNRIPDLAVNNRDHLLKLEPVDGTKLLREA